jgi:PAS domain S-box-containing protein
MPDSWHVPQNPWYKALAAPPDWSCEEAGKHSRESSIAAEVRFIIARDYIETAIQEHATVSDTSIGAMIPGILTSLCTLFGLATFFVASRKNGSARYAGLLDQMRDPFFAFDHSGRVTSWNRGAVQATGFTREEVLGRPFEQLLAPDSVADGQRAFDSFFRQGPQERQCDLCLRARDGRKVALKVSAHRLETEDGPEVACFARESSGGGSKNHFLANVSHEIRTPLHGVIGMNRLLLESELSEEQREWAEAVQTSAEALLDLVNDLLDMSKIESGKLAIDEHPFDLPATMSQCAQVVSPRASEQELHLELEYPENAPRRFIGDQMRIRQILLNFLSNAVKFTPPAGTVRLFASVQRSTTAEPEVCRVRLSVSDTGIGIAPEARERIFEKFLQADSTITRQFGGTGLGLSICRELSALIGGAVGLESQEGKGSTFWLDLELKVESTPAAASALRDVTACPNSQRRILLVEDNKVNQRLLTRMLETRHCEVTIAENGREAIERACSGSYDLIFMDCQMPVLDGYRASAEIRGLENGSRTPIVALTANNSAGDRETCFAAGMDDFLSKPILRDELDEMLRRWLGPVPAAK